VTALARWEAKPSRSKQERIVNKMGEAQCGVGEHKKGSRVGASEREKGRILVRSKSILLFFRARAGY
jgi:hypothetical protein